MWSEREREREIKRYSFYLGRRTVRSRAEGVGGTDVCGLEHLEG